MAVATAATRTATKANKKAKSKYCKVAEVMEMLECGESTAYKVMRELNAELEKKGCITLAGRVSRRYLEERLNF